ncbi:MAG: N-acetyltransferase [Porticoccaceae bacterium]|nr:N-acetyltransferase [Porticoccaceae bacterium]
MPHIRIATPADRDAIHAIHLNAFPSAEAQSVAELAVNLLGEQTTPDTISLMAEVGSTPVGHIAFSPIFADGNHHWQGYILAPLAVAPEQQKAGVGSSLINAGIELLKDRRIAVVLVYGDPGYYGKFGFKPESASCFLPPYPLEYPFGWQALILNRETAPEKAVQFACVDSLNKAELW